MKPVGLGLHEFDGKLIDLSRALIQRRLVQLHTFRTQLAAIDGRQLDFVLIFNVGCSFRQSITNCSISK